MNNDWRMANQMDFLYGARLIKTKFVQSEHNDHEHCEFCWITFSEFAGDIHSGYTTLDRYHWICEQCYNDFRALFDWKLTDEFRLEHSDAYVFPYEDALSYLDLLYGRRQFIVLGVKVLDSQLNFTYDGWSYRGRGQKNHQEESYKEAKEYIVTYKRSHTDMNYFVFTIDKADVMLPLVP